MRVLIILASLLGAVIGTFALFILRRKGARLASLLVTDATANSERP